MRYIVQEGLLSSLIKRLSLRKNRELYLSVQRWVNEDTLTSGDFKNLTEVSNLFKFRASDVYRGIELKSIYLGDLLHGKSIKLKPTKDRPWGESWSRYGQSAFVYLMINKGPTVRKSKMDIILHHRPASKEILLDFTDDRFLKWYYDVPKATFNNPKLSSNELLKIQTFDEEHEVILKSRSRSYKIGSGIGLMLFNLEDLTPSLRNIVNQRLTQFGKPTLNKVKGTFSMTFDSRGRITASSSEGLLYSSTGEVIKPKGKKS